MKFKSWNKILKTYFTSASYQGNTSVMFYLLSNDVHWNNKINTIHLFLAVKMGVAMCKFYGSSFRSHPHPAIFICTKQFICCLILKICMSYHIILMYYLNYEHRFVVQTVLPFTARCYSPRYLPTAANERKSRPQAYFRVKEKGGWT